MYILYSVINFLILAAILYFVGRKIVVRIFRTRREELNSALDQAENAEAVISRFEEETAEAQKKADEKLRLVIEDNEKLFTQKMKEIDDEALEEERSRYSAEERLKNGLRSEMLTRARGVAIKKAEQAALMLFSEEPYVSLFRQKEEMIVDSILKKIRITSGDRAYLAQHDMLYVTLTSCFPLESRLITKVGSRITEMLAETKDKPSFRVMTDSSLVGGLKLRIGDTVYDGSVSDILYRFTSKLASSPLTDNYTGDAFADSVIAEVDNIEAKIDIYQLGRVISVSDGICWLDGLADIMYGEVVMFDCGEQGMILDIQPGKIGCVVFGRYEHIEAGSSVRRVGKMASVPSGDVMLGRVVDPLGHPIDGMGRIAADEYRPIEFPSAPITARAPVSVPMHTGLKAIDTLVPIGRGQRELIIGDRQTGKTSIATDAIINQKGKNVICIYVAIGQKETTVADVQARLRKYGALDYTVIVCADAYSSASMQYIAPFAGTAIGEYYMYRGRDVLIVYDDLSKHAVAYRELSLLLHRPSGREAYPGDIFYLHSRLLERSLRLSPENGGGSMTALPIVETQAGDISAYIPTNVISITDGQIFLEAELFNEGKRPAVNVGLSVSRVGGAAQKPFMKKIASNLRTNLAQYRELETFAQFGSDVDESTRKILESGKRMTESLNQPRNSPLSDSKTALIIYAVAEGFAAKAEVGKMKDFQSALFAYFDEKHPELLKMTASTSKPSAEDMESLRNAMTAFAEEYYNALV